MVLAALFLIGLPYVVSIGLGEDYLTKGIASSRSERIVACVPAVEHAEPTVIGYPNVGGCE